MLIKFTTINVDGKEITREFDSVDEMRADWNAESGTTLPSLDDKLLEASIDEKVNITGGTFETLAKLLDLDDIQGKYKKMHGIAYDISSDADTLCGCIRDEPSGCEGCWLGNDEDASCTFKQHMEAYNGLI